MTRLSGRSAKFAMAAGVWLAGLLVLECGAQLYAYQVAKQGKLFEADDTLGWKVLPSLDLVRDNANGDPWRIETDERGIRGPSVMKLQAKRRLLVLGDSFAFGEGVDYEERFDRIMLESRPDWSIVNLGVMGYGTDQQILSGRSYLPALRRGDVVLLLTSFNDFFDILRTSSSGRAKPHFERTAGGVVEHPPSVGWYEVLRDRSYIAALAGAALSRTETYSLTDIRSGMDLYSDIVAAEVPRWKEQGARLIIAHHGDGMIEGEAQMNLIRRELKRICNRPSIYCIDLDRSVTREQNPDYFLSDGHWSVLGNERVASVLLSRLEAVLN